MGSNMNFNNYSDNPIGNIPLARQPSVYSLTFDELQNTMGGTGKDFGSMNMDELLKNIWTAEEAQALAASSSAGGEGNNNNNNNKNNNYNSNPIGNLQKQGSLTLPRTLSQKKVDEIWRDLVKDSGGGASDVRPSMPQREPTLGEMTIEEFLVKAGVVREDVTQLNGKANGNGWFSGDLARSNNTNTGLTLGFQQPNADNGNLGNRIVGEGNNPVSKQPPNFSFNLNPSQQPPPLFPKPANVAFTSPVHLLTNAQVAGHGRRGGLSGVPASQISPEVTMKSGVNTTPSSLSPVPYVINRGRKSGAIEKVVERRQKRMIKNRESAARSRARKQAYTLELEAELAKLKDMNQELRRKQAQIIEMQKNQVLETMNRPWGGKRQCLRRTFTGPW